MNPKNPACYECPKGKHKLHYWKRNEDGTAICVDCKLVINKSDADEVWLDL